MFIENNRSNTADLKTPDPEIGQAGMDYDKELDQLQLLDFLYMN
jgi:hypothetical protein